MEVVETFGYVKKKEYDLLEKSYKNISYKVFGMRVMLKELEKKVELEYKRAEYWKAKALYPNSEPYVEGDMETIKYIKS